MDEIYILTKHGRFQYGDIENMPVSKRRYFITKLYKDVEEEKKAINSSKHKSKQPFVT